MKRGVDRSGQTNRGGVERRLEHSILRTFYFKPVLFDFLMVSGMQMVTVSDVGRCPDLLIAAAAGIVVGRFFVVAGRMFIPCFRMMFCA